MTDVEDFTEISGKIQALAARRGAEGDVDARTALIELAAKFELESSELQKCWGGALNGQEGRRRLFREILEKIGFDAVFETGTYRGVSTRWFADNFPRTIYSCERELVYFLQARENLAKCERVFISHSDSRKFLSEKVHEFRGKSVFFYLDAHWGEDLPLHDELELITSSGCLSVIAIDDFQVPGESYAFDDYGPGRRLSIEILQFLKETGYRIYFPTLPAASETGAARGVCLLTREFIHDLDELPSVAGGDWAYWMKRQADHDARQVVVEDRKNFDIEENILESKISEELQILQEKSAASVSSLNELRADVEQRFQKNENLLTEVRDIVWAHKSGAHALIAEVQGLNNSQELGRQLVEQRARVLQLERQNYILQEELDEARGKQSSGGVVRTDIAKGGAADLVELEGILQGLSRSRALQILSILAPSPRGDVLSALQKISTLRAKH